MPDEQSVGTSKVRELEVNWSQFIECIHKEKERHHCKWRGVKSHRYPLSSSFQRKVLGPLAEERRSLDHVASLQDKLHRYFSLAIRGIRGGNPAPLDYNQVWAMGRHFGLNTPYLDWSVSPFIAAFFAVFDLIEDYLSDRVIVPDLAWFGSGADKCAARCKPFPEGAKFAIYQLHLSEDLFPWVGTEEKRLEAKKRDRERKLNFRRVPADRQPETWNPFFCDTSASIRRFRPRGPLPKGEYLLFLDVNVEEVRRMQGQRGYFTVLNSKCHLSIESFLVEHDAADCLTKYIIPATELRGAFEHLISHGIDYQLAYPDLEGAAKQANMFCNMDMFHDAEARAR